MDDDDGGGTKRASHDMAFVCAVWTVVSGDRSGSRSENTLACWVLEPS